VKVNFKKLFRAVQTELYFNFYRKRSLACVPLYSVRRRVQMICNKLSLFSNLYSNKSYDCTFTSQQPLFGSNFELKVLLKDLEPKSVFRSTRIICLNETDIRKQLADEHWKQHFEVDSS